MLELLIVCSEFFTVSMSNIYFEKLAAAFGSYLYNPLKRDLLLRVTSDWKFNSLLDVFILDGNKFFSLFLSYLPIGTQHHCVLC